MADIVNLRRARRARAKERASDEAAEARAKHGIAPAGRRAVQAEQDRSNRRLDATMLTPQPSAETSDP